MTVLVAVGDDSLSGQVLDVGARLGRAFDQALYVVHLTEQEAATAGEREIRDKVHAELGDLGIEFEVGIEYVSHERARRGKGIGQQLAEIAEDESISHIVIGHRSKALFERLREGDTAFTVADTANVPVTVVPEHITN